MILQNLAPNTVASQLMSPQYGSPPKAASECLETSQFDPKTKRAALTKAWRYVILLASRTTVGPTERGAGTNSMRIFRQL